MKIYLNSLTRPRNIYKCSFILFSVFVVHHIYLCQDNGPTTPEGLSTEDHKMINFENEYKTKVFTKSYKNEDKRPRNMKYILLWTPTVTPFNLLRKRGRVPFVSNNCQYDNCFLTHKRDYFVDQRNFDAVVFSIAALTDIHELPSVRSSKQKFIAASIDPPQKYPVVNTLFDGYFNWTWTYRLNSDILWRKFRIYDMQNKEVGPKKYMTWSNKSSSIAYIMENSLSFKQKSVVWIKSFCKLERHNQEQLQYIMVLKKELKDLGLTLVIYSNCTGYESCGNIDQCGEKIHDFYFYLSFENYIDEDYVDTLLIAIQHYVVPVVYGGANYSRFLPPGSYIDAQQLSPRKVAKVIDDSMTNFTIFQNYFKQLMHYFYVSTGLESEVCNICAALNNEKMFGNTTVYKNFRKTWNGESSVMIADFLFKAFEENKELKKIMSKNGNYSDILKLLEKKYDPEPQTYVYVFDKEELLRTSTEDTAFMPDELTTSSSSYLPIHIDA